MQQETLKEVFVEQIRDLYDAEKQIVKTLPKVVKAVESEALAEALNHHLKETENHVTRLEQVFRLVDQNVKGKACKGMKGILEEGADIISDQDKGALRDLALIAGCQRVEHYEVSGYGTSRTLAEHLGLNEAVQLLQQTENEETAADEKLTEIAGEIYNSEAAAGEETERMGADSSRRASAQSASRRRA